MTAWRQQCARGRSLPRRRLAKPIWALAGGPFLGPSARRGCSGNLFCGRGQACAGRHQQQGGAQHGEGDVQAGGVGHETDDGGTGQDACVADGRNGRHGQAGWHGALVARCRKQDGHDVCRPQPDQHETQHGQARLGCQHGQEEAAGCAQAAESKHPLSAKAADHLVAGKASHRHGDGEGGVAEAALGFFHAARGGEEQGAPVEDGTFGQEDDEAQQADEDHGTVRHDEQGRLFAGGGCRRQQMALRRAQYAAQQQHHHHTGPGGGQAQPQQQGHAGGTGEAAHAEQRVKARHHGAAIGFFDDHGLDIDGHVERAHGRAEEQQYQAQLQRRGRQGQAGKDGGQQQAGADDDLAAAEAGRQHARKRHRAQRARAQAQQQNAQGGFVEAQARLGVRDQRGPGGHAEAGGKEDQARGALLQGAGEMHGKVSRVSV